VKILHVTPTYLPSIGGIETVIQNLVRQSRLLGATADVAHVAPGLTFDRFETGNSVVWTRPLVGNRLLGWSSDLGNIARQYDLIHVHDPQVAAITLNIALQTIGRPKLLSTHGGMFHTNKLAILKAMHAKSSLPMLLRTYDLILASSQSDYKLFEQYSNNVRLAENGIDGSRFAESVFRKIRPRNRWIYWGRLSRNKRLDEVLMAAAIAYRSDRSLDLLICGNDFDSLAEKLKQQTSELGLTSAVRIEPALSDDALLKEIGSRGVFISASQYEGFGLSIVEALAAGLLVICRDIEPINRFVVNGKTGLHLAFDGSSKDESTISMLMTNRDADWMQMLNNAQRLAAAYDWVERAQVFKGFYEEVLKNNRF
jgi:alpha-1,3-mannosyltransferase